MKKIFLTNLLFFLLLGCGFTPMLSKNKNVSFYIESLNFNNGDRELTSYIKANLDRYLMDNNGKSFKIEGSVDYNKNSISKNSASNTEEYEISAISTIQIFHNGLAKTVVLREDFIMENFGDEFEEMKYEKNIKKSMARSISSKLLMQLSMINAN